MNLEGAASRASGLSRFEPTTMGGVFFVSLSALMLEVTLTRVFSVTMWYHFAFMAVSLALLASVGALLFGLATTKDKSRYVNASVAVFVLLVLLLPFDRLTGVIKVDYVKGRIEPPKVVERWNSFSRIAVFPERSAPLDMALTEKYKGSYPKNMILNIDAAAASAIIKYEGHSDDLEFLKYNVTAVVHYLKKDAKVLVIGLGGEMY